MLLYTSSLLQLVTGDCKEKHERPHDRRITVQSVVEDDNVTKSKKVT